MESSFSIDLTASVIVFVICVFFFLLAKWAAIFYRPLLKFSDLNALNSRQPGLRELYLRIPYKLLILAFSLFLLAFMDPHFYIPIQQEAKEQPVKQVKVPTEGIAIYFILDQSGSMSNKIKALNDRGEREVMSKMDLLKQVTKDFIEGDPDTGLSGRPNDLIGLVTFARGAQVLAPLTLDHQAILDNLDRLHYTSDFNQEGTVIGYAIYKTANLIAATRHYAEDLVGAGKPSYEIKGNIMILVTDGFQSPNPLDKNDRLRNIEMVDAADYARENHIKLYIINVEPQMASNEFALYRKLSRQVAELTGGKFYLLDSSTGLKKIYSEIDQLEKSTLPFEGNYEPPPKSDLPNLFKRVSFYPYLIALGMLCIGIAVLLETVLMRRVP